MCVCVCVCVCVYIYIHTHTHTHTHTERERDRQTDRERERITCDEVLVIKRYRYNISQWSSLMFFQQSKRHNSCCGNPEEVLCSNAA